MAFTYIILNLIIIFSGWLVFRKHIKKPTPQWWITLVGLLVLTAIFDNLMIAAGFFAYNPQLILGVYIGVAPIEDFFYAVLACLLVPAAWFRFSSSKPTAKKGSA